jgi:hypothetical protein
VSGVLLIGTGGLAPEACSRSSAGRKTGRGFPKSTPPVQAYLVEERLDGPLLVPVTDATWFHVAVLDIDKHAILKGWYRQPLSRSGRSLMLQGFRGLAAIIQGL